MQTAEPRIFDELWREVLMFLSEKELLCSAALTCKLWHTLALSEWIWEKKFANRFQGQYSFSSDQMSFFEKFKELSFIHWVAAPKFASALRLSEDKRTIEGLTITGCADRMGCYAKKELSKGKHYFEVLVEELRGSNITSNSAVGISTDPFVVETCWTEKNNGIGIYMDGAAYSYENAYESHDMLPLEKHKVEEGDKIGVFINLDDDVATFYLNGEALNPTFKIKKVQGKEYYLNAFISPGFKLRLHYFGNNVPSTN